jgi:hypothetical protein
MPAPKTPNRQPSTTLYVPMTTRDEFAALRKRVPLALRNCDFLHHLMESARRAGGIHVGDNFIAFNAEPEKPHAKKRRSTV